LDQAIHFLLHYGYWVLFAVVLAEQIGLPIPAVPIFLAMGSLVGDGHFSLSGVVLLAVSASLLSDAVWYELGRRRGRSVVKLVCRIALEPDFCVRRTENYILRRGPVALVFAKFVPGLSIAAPPLVAVIGMRRVLFLLWDGLGALVWSALYIMLGYVFRKQLERAGAYAERMGMVSAVILVIALALFIAWKYMQRRTFLRRLRTDRITPEDLLRKLEKGEDVFVADLRHPLDFEADRFKVPGALRLLPEELDKHHREIPRDRDVVLYCNCLNEATSASVALQLRRLGITRVRPLAGGFETWRGRGFPVEPVGAAARA
jgi:membrane protein DedA with SNARE-associated domain/rhodanese-related sulfurtransferase